jgi:AraC family transcriptional regulator
MPPHEPDGYTSSSAPFSLGVSFTGHAKAIIEDGSGRLSQRTFGPGAFGITGPESIHWLRVAEPSEAFTIYPAMGELADVGEQVRIAWLGYSDFLHNRLDPTVWAVCARFRRAALGAIAISELEAESLVGNLLAHVAVRYLGARPWHRATGRLDHKRLARVTELVEDRLVSPPSLRELAAAAAMSPFHFQRLFRAATGSSPHAYVAARRMERARRMLNEPDATVASVAGALGFSDLAHFRRVFRRQFNASPRGGT